MINVKVDAEHLEEILADLARYVNGWCSAASVFIGEIGGRPVRVEVMTLAEAKEEHDYDGAPELHRCLNNGPAGEAVAYGKTPGCKQCDEAEACGLTFCPECDAQLAAAPQPNTSS